MIFQKLRAKNLIILASVLAIILVGLAAISIHLLPNKYKDGVILEHDGTVTFGNNTEYKLAPDSRNGFLTFPDTAFEGLLTLYALKIELKQYLEIHPDSSIYLQLSDTSRFLIWRVLTKTTYDAHSGRLKIRNQKGDSMKLLFDYSETNPFYDKRSEEKMLRVKIWDDSLSFQKLAADQESFCMCGPPKVDYGLHTPENEITKFAAKSSRDRANLILSKIKENGDSLPVYFSFKATMKSAEILATLSQISQSNKITKHAPHLYFDDLHWEIGTHL